MATKPTDLVRWAETAGGTPSSEIDTPSSGKRDSGWTDGEIPPHDIFNYLAWALYQWIKYLNDGVFTGTVSFAADGIVGDTNSTGDIQADDLYHTDTLEAWVMPADFQWQGTDWTYTPGAHDGTTVAFIESGTDKVASAPIHLPADAVITGLTVYFNRAGGDYKLGIVQAVLSTGVGSAVHATTVNSGGPGTQTYTSGALSYRLGSGLGDRGYELVINPATASATFYGARITYTRPRP